MSSEKTEQPTEHKIRKARDAKGEKGGTKRSISDLSVEQFTAMIGSINTNTPSIISTVSDSTGNGGTPGINAGTAFGGRESAKQKRVS